MTLLKSFALICFTLLTSPFALAAAPSSKPISRNELIDKISFQYMTSDGDYQLSCKHLPNAQLDMDFDVYCGKGTSNLKQYLVHLIIRPIANKPDETSYEILYWVTDRSQGNSPVFSSTSQIITLDQETRLKRLSLSQSLENDSAQLYLSYKL